MDRNWGVNLVVSSRPLSLSARRAWIEMSDGAVKISTVPVALRKESVDRNERCWFGMFPEPVALRKESVDRNAGQ